MQSKGWLLWLGLALVVAAGSIAWWYSTASAPDMSAVYSLNNEGVGLMERFQYDRAVPIFEKIVEMAPDWTPGHINLGIALLNRQEREFLDRAIDIFERVLTKEPENIHAHFCLGLIFQDRGEIDNAYPHFKRVTDLDPDDGHGWYYRAMTLDDESKSGSRKEWLEKSVGCDANLRRSLGQLHPLQRGAGDAKQADETLNTFKGLDRLFDPEKSAYGELGKYSEAISMPPRTNEAVANKASCEFQKDSRFQANLKAGARWASAADFGMGPVPDLRREIRNRFGSCVVVLDFNQDGKPDLFLLGAVLENGRIRDLLLRNEGNRVFTDVTHDVGLAEPRPSLGCTVSDFDNDGYPDLFITGAGRNWLFRNQMRLNPATPLYEDVTKEAGLDKLGGVFLGSCFVDLDQDMDLDLVVARYAASPEEALQRLKRGQSTSSPAMEIFLNVGEAKVPLVAGHDLPPLRPAFRKLEWTTPDNILGAGVAIAATDLDGDRDIDLVLLADGTGGTAIINDRLLRLRSMFLPAGHTGAGRWNGALVLDANHDGRSDLFLINPDRAPLFLLSQAAGGTEKDLEKSFRPVPCLSPALSQAQAIDIDNDGWTDVIGLTEKRRPVLLRNHGGRLVHVPDGLGNDQAWPDDILSINVVALEDTCFCDLIIWSKKQGLQLVRNQGNADRALKIRLIGHRQVRVQRTDRCNADGIGTWVIAQTADFWTGLEYTTLSAGLGQSRQPIHLGMGKHDRAEVLRLRWPDNCWQAELNLPTCKPLRIDQHNRKPDSCPVLFTWDGERYVFVADFLGGGTLGEAMPDGQCMQPRPEESVKIETRQMKPRNGFYELKIAEPMDEVTYLDELKLLVVDHPADIAVYPDERFALSGPPPSQDLLAYRQAKRIFPVKAMDHRGRDIKPLLESGDRKTVDQFARRAWTGFAEDHWVELDFGDQLSRFGADQPLVMFLTGWTDYAYPDAMWAANQAGIGLQSPKLERLGEDGRWRTVIQDTGFPAGLPRMMTVDVTGKLTGPRCVLRLRTNMTVYWDQIFIAPVAERLAKNNVNYGGADLRTRLLPVADAVLEKRGFMKEVSPDGRRPELYDYDQFEKVPFTRQIGSLTRLGDVSELLNSREDRFVIFGPGEEIAVRFDSRNLPSLPSGWQRSFVLRTAGYCKGCGPFTLTGGNIDPLPFRAMTRFPYGANERYPQTPRHRDYLQRYNTRFMAPSGR